MKITKPEQIEEDKFYWCEPKTYEFNSDILKAYGDKEQRYLGVNKIWCNESNPQAFDKYDIYGPIELKDVEF